MNEKLAKPDPEEVITITGPFERLVKTRWMWQQDVRDLQNEILGKHKWIDRITAALEGE